MSETNNFKKNILVLKDLEHAFPVHFSSKLSKLMVLKGADPNIENEGTPLQYHTSQNWLSQEAKNERIYDN